MKVYSHRKLLKYIFYLSILGFIQEIISNENIILNSFSNNLESYNKNEIQLSTDENTHDLDIKYNIINFTEKNNEYSLKLNSITSDKELLLYTNLTDGLITFVNVTKRNISKFELFSWDFIQKNKQKGLLFTKNSSTYSGIGFIDFYLVNKGEFHINYETEREKFYNKIIKLNEISESNHYYINFIPKDNNSDLYYFEFYFDPHKKEAKEKVELFYLNELNNTINETLDNLNKKQVKRNRNIKGKIEIFALKCKGPVDTNLTLKYVKNKGNRMLGFIVSTNVFFVALIIISTIFFKNAYFNKNDNENSVSRKEVLI
jgi:hypothetical protein